VVEQPAGTQEEHILKRFADEYDRSGFSKYFQLFYHQACRSEKDGQPAEPKEQAAAVEEPDQQWRAGLPLLVAVAQPEPWDMPGVERGIGVMNDMLLGKDIGEFTMIVQLEDLVVPSAAVVWHFAGWLKEHSTGFQWQLVAMAIIVKKGLLGQVARAVVGILTAAVATSAKFKIFFDEPAARDWLQEPCAEHAAAPPAPAAKTCGDASADGSETTPRWWSGLRG